MTFEDTQRAESEFLAEVAAELEAEKNQIRDFLYNETDEIHEGASDELDPDSDDAADAQTQLCELAENVTFLPDDFYAILLESARDAGFDEDDGDDGRGDEEERWTGDDGAIGFLPLDTDPQTR